MAQTHTNNISQEAAALLDLLGSRPLVLVGMMGAGKTTVGKRLATRLNRKFIDSDAEIEIAAGMSIEDMFALHGEGEFRAGEAKVIARLLNTPDIVLGTGGGAFMAEQTRDLIKAQGVSVWLKAEFDILFDRVSRRANRPLLKTANPRQTLRDLIDARYPVYAKADVTILSRDVPHDVIAAEIVTQVHAHLKAKQEKA